MTNQAPFQRTPEEQALFAQLVSQLQDLVQLALECKDKEPRPGLSLKEVFSQVQRLRVLADALHKSLDPSGASSAQSEQQQMAMKARIATLPPQEKKLYEALEKMKKECEGARADLYKSLQENQATLKQVEENLRDDAGKKTRRKGKFKGIGGKKGWLPS
jgi:chromosome segregation ATPase